MHWLGLLGGLFAASVAALALLLLFVLAGDPASDEEPAPSAPVEEEADPGDADTEADTGDTEVEPADDTQALAA